MAYKIKKKDQQLNWKLSWTQFQLKVWVELKTEKWGEKDRVYEKIQRKSVWNNLSKKAQSQSIKELQVKLNFFLTFLLIKL